MPTYVPQIKNTLFSGMFDKVMSGDISQKDIEDQNRRAGSMVNDPANFSDLPGSKALGEAEKGQNFDFLAEYLRGSLEKGMPFKQEFIQGAVGNVNQAFNRAGTRMRETFADKGTFGSGVHAAASAELGGQRGAAIGGVVNQINLQDLEFRKDAIYKLLGLNKFDAESENIAKNMLEQSRQFDVSITSQEKIAQMQIDAQESGWGDIFGSAASAWPLLLL